jgi:hypothetical protein
VRLSTGRALTSLAVVCGLLAAGACSEETTPQAGGEVEPGPEAVSEAERLTQLVNDSRAVTDELTLIEHRITKRCLEDEGFDVHDPMMFQTPSAAAYDASGYLSGAPLWAVPTPEAAEQWGFGMWTEWLNDSGDEDLADELLTPEAMAAFGLLDEEHSGLIDTSEWDAQDQDYHAEWIEAYSGAPAIVNDVKVEADFEAPPGGCWLKMVETMYGEPYMLTYEGEDGEEDTEVAQTHEPSPVFMLEEFEDFSGLLATVREEADAFESCLVDAGYVDWELDETFNMPLWHYFTPMYAPEYFEEYGDEEGLEVPEGPEEVPADFKGVLELERAMAVDFAACGQESGLREAIEQGWAAMLVEAYRPIETDLVAWQETMQGHLDNAQDYLEE